FLFLLRCSRFPSGPRCYFVSVRAPLPPPFPYTTLFRSLLASRARACSWRLLRKAGLDVILERAGVLIAPGEAHMVSGQEMYVQGDRKSTRLNSSHVKSSYAVFCLKKKNRRTREDDVSLH